MERQLAGLDSAFLSLETRSAPLHVAAAVVLEPSPDGNPPDSRGIRRHLAPRLTTLPVFRRRIQEVPLGLDHPFWVEETELDLDAHVHCVTLPPPGSESALAELVGHLASRPLDRDLPLWELWVVEGLEGQRAALVAKLHHALIDGVAGAAILAQLLDGRSDATAALGCRPQVGRTRAPTRGSMLSTAALALGALPLRVARQLWRTAGAAARVVGAVAGESPVSGPRLAAPDSCLNGALSPRRAVVFADVPLRKLEHVKHTFGVKLNDVVLAACAGALRSCLQAWDRPSREPLVAAIPVAVARDGDASNAVTATRVELPVEVADPVERLNRIHRSSSRAKRVQRAAGGDLLAGWADLATPGLLSRLADLYSHFDLAGQHRPLANLVVSNVPGPRSSLYCAGHEVRACYPLGPVYEGWGLNVTVLSYAGRVQLGLMACPSVVPEPARISDAFECAVAELHDVATTGPTAQASDPRPFGGVER